jgi:alcohol dehydrogenase (cytochrome c)
VNYGAIRAIDPSTGERRWEFRYQNPSMAGVLSTASGLVFTGDGDGNFMALDSKTGADLWHFQMGSSLDSFQSGTGIYAAPTTYTVEGRQYVLLPAGTTLMAFALYAPTDP